MSYSRPIAFIDLQSQRERIGGRVDAAVLKVLAGGQYILGPEVAEVERQLAAFAGVKHCISCSSGTDALLLPLMAWGVGPGDAVFVPTFTFVATGEAPALLEATPVFVDVDPDTFNMDVSSLEAAITHARKLGLKPRVVVPVDLFGLPADYDAIQALARANDLLVLADAAQSFGASKGGRPVGSLGDATATSFFPAKPLGCYGDGGAVFTDDDAVAELMRSVRVHGQGSDRYENVRVGINGRFDTIQAAILIEKLAIFPDEIQARERVATRYSQALEDVFGVPSVPEGYTSVWAQYTLRTQTREPVLAALKAAQIPAGIYYPIPMHRQRAYAHYPADPRGLPVSEALAEQVFSLPMHPYLDAEMQDYIISAALSSQG
jgi:dTDP-4-amino-4,6-dideoxygalactose transaminase